MVRRFHQVSKTPKILWIAPSYKLFWDSWSQTVPIGAKKFTKRFLTMWKMKKRLYKSIIRNFWRLLILRKIATVHDIQVNIECCDVNPHPHPSPITSPTQTLVTRAPTKTLSSFGVFSAAWNSFINPLIPGGTHMYQLGNFIILQFFRILTKYFQ